MIDKIIEILNKDGLIAIPTDTVYGLIGNPESKIAVDKLYKIKNRDYSKKLSIFLSNRDKIKDICIVDNYIESFIQNELKNNTIILKKKDKNYLNLISDNYLGMRIPNNDFILKLLKKYGKPVFATSINSSGEKECLTYQEVLEKFGIKIDFIVKNETIFSGKPSNIYKMENNQIIKIR
ncbi:MAG: L-threonylcarbamoyladenylate synthase [Rickettsiales bacterium]|nr:L-threonylcarbamoyladenylate synthase [Rickettsiales bacterium]